VRLLRQTTFFGSFSDEALALLEASSINQEFLSGSVLLVQTESSAHVYVIMQGAVRLERSHPALATPVIAGELGPGDLVGGEELLQADGKSSYTAIALRATQTLALPLETLREVLMQFPPSNLPWPPLTS
jgi:CRP-like cAMP-binding protein